MTHANLSYQGSSIRVRIQRLPAWYARNGEVPDIAARVRRVTYGHESRTRISLLSARVDQARLIQDISSNDFRLSGAAAAASFSRNSSAITPRIHLLAGSWV